MFETNRSDGRSMPDVVLAVLSNADPGAFFSYKDLIDALNNGSSKIHDVRDVRGAVARTKSRLLREHFRTVRNVVGKGYKVASANEHREIAILHKVKSDRQLFKGVQTLKHVKWDELEPETRKAHEGTLMLMSAMYERQDWMERRMKKIEDILHKIDGGNPDEHE